MGIRVGVIGAGRIGKIHSATLASMREHVELITICDPRLDKLWAKTLNAQPVINEDEFFACDLDAVIVASPTDQHYRHIMRALERGLHVLCEKPVDFSLAAHDAIEEKLRDKNCQVQIGFNRRFDADFAKIAYLNQQTHIGQPYLLRITSRDPGLPSLDYLRGSGGMFVDMTIHDFDMARFVMQSEVVEVFAFGATLVDQRLAPLNDIDTAVITLKFANGAFGVIDNSRQAIYGYDQRLELFGSLGSIANNHHRRYSIETSDVMGCHQEPMLNFFLERYASSYQREMNAFITCIKDNSPCSPTIDDARMALALALAAQESMANRRPIRLKD